MFAEAGAPPSSELEHQGLVLKSRGGGGTPPSELPITPPSSIPGHSTCCLNRPHGPAPAHDWSPRRSPSSPG